MEMRKIISDFFDSSIRVEKLIHLGTMCMDDVWPEIASEAFEEDAEDVWEALEHLEPDDACKEEWSETLRCIRKLGFLVQFATPVPYGFSGNGYSCSWGQYTTQWIYGDSFELACARALKWQEEFIEASRAAQEAVKTQPQPCDTDIPS
mgnify:CR=1 FL=1